MTRYIPLVFLIMACSVPLSPEERGIEVDRDAVVHNQTEAMVLFEAMVEEAFDVDLDDVFFDAVVWWTSSTCQGRDGYWIQFDGQCFKGGMWSCQEMYVARSRRDAALVCGTSLLHEFGHCLAGHVFGDFQVCYNDGEHYGPIWGVVAEAKVIACERGW